MLFYLDTRKILSATRGNGYRSSSKVARSLPKPSRLLWVALVSEKLIPKPAPNGIENYHNMFVAPRLRATGLPCIAAQRSRLLATHNILVQKTTSLLILARHSLVLHQVARPSGTHDAAEQYVHYLVNIKGASITITTWQRNDDEAGLHSTGHRCGHDLDLENTPFQWDFPESWHDTPGQYIECTCKLTTKHKHNDKKYHDI